MRNRRAFTVVEVLIAIVVLTVGLLGLVSTAAWAARMIATGRHRAEAAALAGRHLAAHHDRPCTNGGAGEQADGRYSVTWSAASLGPGVELVTLTVTARGGERRAAASFTAARAC